MKEITRQQVNEAKNELGNEEVTRMRIEAMGDIRTGIDSLRSARDIMIELGIDSPELTTALDAAVEANWQLF